MDKKGLREGIVLIVGAVLLDMIFPYLAYGLISRIIPYPMTAMFIVGFLTITIVTILLVKGGGKLLNAANRSRTRIENAKLALVAALLIFMVPRVLQVLIGLSYYLSTLIGNIIYFNARYFISHLLSIGVFILGLKILLKEQSEEEMRLDDQNDGQPVPYSKVTYIGGAIVALPFLLAGVLMFEELFLYMDDYLLPSNPTSSNLYWSLAIICILLYLFYNGLQFYTVEYRDASSGRKLGMTEVDGGVAFQDQILALLQTFFMPILVGALVALIPYYIAYFTIGFFLMNGFTIALLILILLGIFGALFVVSRLDKNKTAEIIWLVSWFFIGLIVLFFVQLFMFS